MLKLGKLNFEIVENIPDGFVIWNIGRENFPFKKFIPLCKVDENYNVDLDNLKAFECWSEEKALEVMDFSIKHTANKKQILNILTR